MKSIGNNNKGDHEGKLLLILIILIFAGVMALVYGSIENKIKTGKITKIEMTGGGFGEEHITLLHFTDGSVVPLNGVYDEFSKGDTVELKLQRIGSDGAWNLESYEIR